jgi:broad specificity phosphatase PhoE
VLATQDEVIRQLATQFERDRHGPEGGRSLQKLFEAVCRVWCNGEYDVDGLESWPAFRARVEKALVKIREMTPRSSNVVAFSSGGPIAASVGYTLDLLNSRAIEFVWLTRNASFSEFVFSGTRMSMASYNSIPHLDDRALVTYR